MFKYMMKRTIIAFLFLLQCGQALVFPVVVRFAAAGRICSRCARTRRAKKAIGTALITTGALVAGGSYALQRKRDVYTPEPGSLVGQTMVVTGASSGLGLESAKRLACAGANLVLTARSRSKGTLAVATVNALLEELGLLYEENRYRTRSLILTISTL
jgi:short chain dehydrogenase